MKRVVLAAVAAGLFWSAISPGIGSPGDTGARAIPLESARWRPGDVVFRRGTGVEARVVESLDGSGYTHVGILAGAHPNWTVIHVEPANDSGSGRVEEVPLAVYLSAGKATAMLVLQATTSEAAAAAITHARKQLGKPFDAQYRYSTDEALYCTELVGKAYAAAGDQIVPQGVGVEIVMLDEKLILPEALLIALKQRKRQAAFKS